MGLVRVFVDANVLFSAALGGASFDLLWELAAAGKIELLTSRYCRLEAERNLSRKKPQALERYREWMSLVRDAPDPVSKEVDVPVSLPEKDVPVYAVAVAARVDVLLTGDRKHFGALMTRGDLPLRVRTVREFLLEGRDGAGASTPIGDVDQGEGR